MKTLEEFFNGAKTVAVVCNQWGDTGKGKFGDYFAEWADIIARGTGGANAGHTIVVNNNKYIFLNYFYHFLIFFNISFTRYFMFVFRNHNLTICIKSFKYIVLKIIRIKFGYCGFILYVCNCNLIVTGMNNETKFKFFLI